MQTLDFGEIMEHECWYEEYELTCPYCRGEGKCKCETCNGEGFVECAACESSGQIDDQECAKCDGEGYWACEDCDGSGPVHCEHCSEGTFEVYWNMAFEVKVRHDWLDVDRDGDKWKEAHKLAWDMGFCLIEHGQLRYLLMGMCGQDCTWLIHYTRWKLQGFLDLEDCYQCLGSSGHVFLHEPKRQELCRYVKGHLTTPENYARSYARDIVRLDAIIGGQL